MVVTKRGGAMDQVEEDQDPGPGQGDEGVDQDPGALGQEGPEVDQGAGVAAVEGEEGAEAVTPLDVRFGSTNTAHLPGRSIECMLRILAAGSLGKI